MGQRAVDRTRGAKEHNDELSYCVAPAQTAQADATSLSESLPLVRCKAGWEGRDAEVGPDSLVGFSRLVRSALDMTARAARITKILFGPLLALIHSHPVF
jgi:hypothetical protein